MKFPVTVLRTHLVHLLNETLALHAVAVENGDDGFLDAVDEIIGAIQRAKNGLPR